MRVRIKFPVRKFRGRGPPAAREASGTMKHEDQHDSRSTGRPRNKATMDEPQEEFIEADSSHGEHDREHGDELQHASHTTAWGKGPAAEDR